jgi:hypothetical protein
MLPLKKHRYTAIVWGAVNCNSIFGMFLLLVIDGTPKDFNNKCNRMQPSKIKKQINCTRFLKKVKNREPGIMCE